VAEVRDFRLPDLGEGLEEGEIVAWHVEVGDVIELNQVIADIETAKAVVEVPSPFAGRVVERLAEVGQSLQVGDVLVRVEATDAAGEAAAEGETPPGEDEPPSGNEQATQTSVLDAEEEPQPLVGYGQGKAGPPRRRRRRGGGGATPQEPAATKPLAKPPVRKLAKDLDIDLADLAPGSGDGGVITREDVLAAADAPAATIGAPAAPAPAAAAAPGEATGAEGEAAGIGFRGRRPGEVEPMRGIRGRIAARMETSRRDIPEATCSRDADLTELWELREDLSELARSQGFEVRISPFAVVLRATVIALRRFPTLNARIEGRDGDEPGEIHLLEPIHLGVAIDTERGLLVPVIHDAHQRSLLELALALEELAEGARAGTLSPRQLTGGTFTVNNYGAFGNDDGDPIINHPEAGILGVGAIRERPWVVHPHGDDAPGEIAVRRVARFTLAFDHRVCDGGEAGRFVTHVADLCERPARLLLHA
jgi:2-oxoisovalerate dehydrogenase E2 component (dihydrolipoyl transacylase)